MADDARAATIASRKAAVKKTLDEEDARKKRTEFAVTLRKEAREQQLAKRRNITTEGAFDSATAELKDEMPNIAQLSEYAKALMNSESEQVLLWAVTMLRKILSVARNPPIDAVVACGVLPRLMQIAASPRGTRSSQLLFETSWALTNIASGSAAHTAAVVDAGAIDVFVELLTNDCESVRDQAIWLLGNIAGDRPDYRNRILTKGVLQRVVPFLNEHAGIQFIRNAAWTFSNLCRGKPSPPLDIVRPLLPTLGRLLYSNDEETVTDVAWALCFSSDGSDAVIDAVLETGIASRLVELLDHPSDSLRTASLRTIGNLVTGDEIHTQVLVNNNALIGLTSMLRSGRKGILKEACWAISNILAGPPEQIQAAFDANVVQVLVHLATTAAYDIRKEALWSLSNATAACTDAQAGFLVTNGVIPVFSAMLDTVVRRYENKGEIDDRDEKVVIVCLEGADNILRKGNAVYGGLENNMFVDVAEKCDLPNTLVRAQEVQLPSRGDNPIFTRARKLIIEYFGGQEEDDEDDGDDGDENISEVPYNDIFPHTNVGVPDEVGSIAHVGEDEMLPDQRGTFSFGQPQAQQWGGQPQTSAGQGGQTFAFNFNAGFS